MRRRKDEERREVIIILTALSNSFENSIFKAFRILTYQCLV